MTPESLKALKERLERPRRFDVQHNGHIYHMQLPDPFSERCALPSTDDPAWFEKAARNIVQVALVGWEGVTYADLLRDKDDSTLEFSPEIAALLLNERLDILDALRDQLVNERTRRRESIEEDAKNSGSASTGS